MSDVIIRAENLGKSYSIRHSDRPERYTALRDVLSQQAQSAWRRLRRPFYRDPSANFSKNEEFWALKDVSFEIQRGEAVGIIGRNGAGKSTLLKVLSRITEPTTGRVTLRGRVASLLEVGTGFHPELTGRENVYLNGAILGMTRAEITRKFDEIVDFAGVEQFLDTPVKRYSSGMYVRLAFAVAAHLEPEILVVDEVLAVGDAEFQKKCLGKMQDVARGGRTILFISHNLAAVETLCTRGIVLRNGCLQVDSKARLAIDAYRESLRDDQPYAESVWLKRRVTSDIHLTGLRILHLGREAVAVPACGEVVFRIAYASSGVYTDCHFRVKIFNELDQVVAKWATDALSPFDGMVGDVGIIECIVPEFNLMPGAYTVAVAVKRGSERVDFVRDAARFQVIATAVNGSGKLPDEGICIVPCHWRRAHHDRDELRHMGCSAGQKIG